MESGRAAPQRTSGCPVAWEFQLCPSWDLLWGKEASGNFPVSASETSLLTFSFEGHLIARCYSLFICLLHLSHHSVFQVNRRRQK